MRIGQRVRDIKTGWEMTVIGIVVANLDLDNPEVYCDFEKNEGDVWEYEPEDLEQVK